MTHHDHHNRREDARRLVRALTAREDALEAPAWLSLELQHERQAVLDAYPLPGMDGYLCEIAMQVLFDMAADFARRSGVIDEAASPLVAALMNERLERITQT
jgi:hypothetical protein